jgi:hypothetical protein
MVVVHENPDELVLEDRAKGPKLVVAAGTGIAVLFAIFARDLELLPRVFPVVVMLGVSTIVFASRGEVFRFDRATGLLSVQLREPRGLATTRTIAFSEIQDVQVEAKGIGDNATYRVKLVLAEADPLYLTRFGTSWKDQKDEVAWRVKWWLTKARRSE